MSAAGLDGARGREEVQREAARWVGRSRDLDDQDLALLDRWIEEDEAHADAYADALAVWHDLGQVLPDWKRDTIPVPEPRPAVVQRSLMAFAAFASLVLVCFLTVQWMASPTSFATGIGEQRTVTLADGSRATLNTDSAIRVARFGDERRVTLERGEVLFDVAHDSQRPFLVGASGRTVRVLGTSFIVRREAQRVDVTLLSGTVTVEQSGAAAVRLNPGQRYRQVSGQAARIDKPRIDMVTAWRKGELMLDETPLIDAIAEMNRYNTRPIILHDISLGQKRLSGVFDTGDTAAFAGTIAAIYDLRVVVRPDGHHLTRARATERR